MGECAAEHLVTWCPAAGLAWGQLSPSGEVPLLDVARGPGEAAVIVSSLLHQAFFLVLSFRRCPPLTLDAAARRLAAAVAFRPLRRGRPPNRPWRMAGRAGG
eukprot:8451886-Alexandrium_andersonii.AAC.1